MRRRLWIVWLILLAIWTAVLLVSISPGFKQEVRDFTWDHEAFVAKSLHGLGYAALTVFAGALQVRTRYRWLLSFALVAHAWATEMAQWLMNFYQITNREGSVMDVGYDTAGIALGFLLAWKWWTREDEIA